MQIEIEPIVARKLKELRKHQVKLVPPGQKLVSITGQINMMLRLRIDEQMKDFVK